MKLTLLKTLLVFASAGLIGNQAIAANGQICPECRRTARITLQSDMSAARSDYYLAVARASAATDEEERAEFLEEGREEYRETVTTAQGSYQVRLNLCMMLKECQYDPEIDPENFLSPEEIVANPNPYYPLVPGTIFIYEAETEDGLEHIEVEITDETREILGIECIVVKDTVWLDGEVIEDTFDWYAQDEEGNVWYFGELTYEYEDGEISGIEGSWEAGRDGAKPGIVMLANPEVGVTYRQELLVGEAEDAGEIIAINETVDIDYGLFENCAQTHDINPHNPFELEYKYYAPGIGFILEVKPEEDEVLELVEIIMP